MRTGGLQLIWSYPKVNRNSAPQVQQLFWYPVPVWPREEQKEMILEGIEPSIFGTGIRRVAIAP